MSQHDMLGLWLLAIAGSEALTVFAGPVWGMVAYLALLLVLIAGASVAGDDPARRPCLALGLVPLIRIVALSLPLSRMPAVYSHLILALPILIGAAGVALALNMRRADLGLAAPRHLELQAAVALLGAAIGLADYFILRPEPLAGALTWRSILVPALVLLFTAGFVENLVFRGVLQGASQVFPAGWIYVALASAMLQMGHRSAPHMALAIAMALVYGWTVKRTGSILGVCLSQGVAAICLYLVFPFVL